MTEMPDARPQSGHPKVRPAHLGRAAIVYVRQSSPGQVERNTESTDRQYALVERAVELGWARRAVEVIDEDLGISGSGAAPRSGFARLTADVALGRVGIVLGLEVSRLARNNADWYRLLDLAGITDTLIADADGIYHPSSFNDRLRAWAQRDNERSRAARAARPAGGRDPQQGSPRRAPPGPARRAGLGRRRRRDPAAPR